MFNQAENDTAPEALEKRIQALERENQRLVEELEERKRIEEAGRLDGKQYPVMDETGDRAELRHSYNTTEHNKLEDALRESEYRFRTMANGVSLIIWVTNAAGGIDFINQAYTDFFDVTLEHVQTMGWQMLVHPDDKIRYVDHYLFCHNQRQPFHGQARVYRKDGEWRWIESFGQPRFSDSGDYLGMVGSSRDITERVEAEKALRENEAKFRSAFENAAIGFALATPDGRFVDANKAYCRLLGYSLDELLQLRLFQPIHPDDLEAMTPLFEKLFVDELRDFVIETRNIRKDGQLIWLRRSVSAVKSEEGSLEWLLSLTEDIDEQKRAEDELKKSEENFRVALKNSPMLVYTTDRDLRYTWIYNPSFGLEFDNIIGKKDEELNEPENVAELVALKKSVLESGVGKRQEIQLGYQGQIFYYDLTVEPIRDGKGDVTGLTVAAVDITSKKRLEQVARENQIQFEMQRRLMEQREQDRLAIAQDIHDGATQTLVTALIDLQMIEESLDSPKLQEELIKIGSSIQSAVQELREAVSELRPPEILESGIAAALRLQVDNLHEKYPQIECVCDAVEDVPGLSGLVRLTLFRICQEALNNVVRHSGATKVEVRLSYFENMVVLEVEDNGKGFDAPADPRSKIEEGHYGVAGMKERAEALGGSFQLASIVDIGTTVSARIPTKA